MKNIEEVSRLEERIGYIFKDKTILIEALTHSSYANEKKSRRIHNERLEFLGDSVLSLIVTEYMYKNYPKCSEGKLSKIRAGLVCEKSLYEISARLSIREYIFLGKGEELTGGRNRVSILSDVLEAIIGGIYIDGGIEKSREFILTQFKKLIDEAIKEENYFADYKTLLQEILQKDSSDSIEYILKDEKGPDHDKIFYTQVVYREKVLGEGVGKNKKSSEQMAAKDALKRRFSIE